MDLRTHSVVCADPHSTPGPKTSSLDLAETHFTFTENGGKVESCTLFLLFRTIVRLMFWINSEPPGTSLDPGERNAAAAGWLVRTGGRLKFRGHLRREESLRQNRNPRRSTVRMCKECLMCILCPCSLFFGSDCRKNLQRESRFCLRLSTHSCGIVPGT